MANSMQEEKPKRCPCRKSIRKNNKAYGYLGKDYRVNTKRHKWLGYYVYCTKCGAQGNYGDERADVIFAWNEPPSCLW